MALSLRVGYRLRDRCSEGKKINSYSRGLGVEGLGF